MEPSFGATLCLTNFWFIDHTQTRPFLFHRGLSARYTNGTVRKSVRCLPKSWCNTSVPDINASTVAEGHLYRDVIFWSGGPSQVDFLNGGGHVAELKYSMQPLCDVFMPSTLESLGSLTWKQGGWQLYHGRPGIELPPSGQNTPSFMVTFLTPANINTSWLAIRS